MPKEEENKKSKKEVKQEIEELARFLYSLYKNNPEIVKEVLDTSN